MSWFDDVDDDESPRVVLQFRDVMMKLLVFFNFGESCVD